MIAKWDITTTCNLNCSHCCTGGREYKDLTRTLGIDEVREVMERLRDAGIKKLQLTGGEPLLRKDLPLVMDMAQDYFDGVILNTNGLYFRGHWLSPERLRCFEQIIFSLDGPDADTHEAVRGSGTFAPLVQNIRAATEAIHGAGLDIPVTLNAILSKPVVDRAADFIRLTKELGADVFAINSVVMVANAGENADAFQSVTFADKYRFITEMVRESRELGTHATFEATPLGYAYVNYLTGARFRTVFHCGAAQTGLYVQADGKVRPCMRATGDMASNDAALEGAVPDLSRQSVAEALGSDYFAQFDRLRVGDASQLRPCNTCRFVDHCSSCRFDYARDQQVDECMFLNAELDALTARIAAGNLAAAAG